MKIGGIDPIVFDARTSAGAAPGSSFLGQIAFQYATDGVFASAPTSDDHVYLDTTPVDTTHAGLQYTGLKLLSVDTSDEELHAEVRNTSPRLFRAYLTTPTLTPERLHRQGAGRRSSSTRSATDLVRRQLVDRRDLHQPRA